jgi:hypothetical protein
VARQDAVGQAVREAERSLARAFSAGAAAVRLAFETRGGREHPCIYVEMRGPCADERRCTEECKGDAQCVSKCVDAQCETTLGAIRARIEKARSGDLAALFGVQPAGMMPGVSLEMMVKDVELVDVRREGARASVTVRVWFLPLKIPTLVAAAHRAAAACLAARGTVEGCPEMEMLLACAERRTYEEVRECVKFLAP